MTHNEQKAQEWFKEFRTEKGYSPMLFEFAAFCLDKREKETGCVHPYAFIIGEEHGNPRCLKCGKILL